MKKRLQYWFVCVIVCLTVSAAAQVSTGTPTLGSFSSGPDVINLGNLNSHFAIPVFSKPGRGTSFDYILSLDSSVWTPVVISGTKTWQPDPNWGWRAITEAATGFISRQHNTVQCLLDPGDEYLPPRPPRYINEPQWTNYQYHDVFGVNHAGFTNVVGGCVGDIDPSTSVSTDTAGWMLDTSSGIKLTTPQGKIVVPPLDLANGAATVTDRNGNKITTTSGSTFTDTLGMTALSVTGSATAISPLVMTYTTTSGTPASVTASYTNYTVQTNFNCTGASAVAEYGPTPSIPLVSSVSLPDGSSYSFQYELTPGHSPNVTGRIQQITLRTGGTITYTYTGGSNGIECVDGSTAGLTRVTTDGTSTYARSGSGTAWATTFTDATTPAPANQTVINFQTAGTPAQFLETHRTVNQGPSTVLAQTDTCYNGATPSCTGTAVTLPITEIKKYTTLNNGQQSLADRHTTANGLVTEVDTYDFGTPTFGILLKKVTISYAALGNNIGGMPSAITTFDGGGTQKAKQTFVYDGTVATATSGVPQHIAVTGSRGNLTSSSQWLDTTGTNLTTTLTYEDTGNVLTSTDPGGHVIQFIYTPDNFTDGVIRTSHAYLTQVTLPDTNSPNLAHHILKAQYDANTGRTSSFWDQNNNATALSYDSMLRTVQVNYPDGGHRSLIFDNFNQSHTETKVDSSRISYSYTIVDGYGRLSRLAQTSGETTPYNQQDLCYNTNGQLAFQAYSYQGTGFAAPIVCSVSGDTLAYDGLGRMTQRTHSDSSNVLFSFNGRAIQTRDEGNGSFNVTRVQQSNALGQITGVCEVTAVTLLGNGGTPISCGLDITATGFLTSNSYNALGNLITVMQGTLASRTFAYDSLSRMTSENHPEWGSGSTMSYTYDNDGSLISRVRPASNQTNPAVTTTTSFQYDSLHRLLSRGYTGDPTGTPGAGFAYDWSTAWGLTLSNGIGMLSSTSVADGSSGQVIGYDAMGRITTNEQCTPHACGILNYGYDLAGDIISASNGAGVTFGYTYNAAPRLTGMTSSLVDISHPATLLSNVHYGRFGTIGDTLGNSLTETSNYNSVGALQSYTTAPTTPYSFSLGYASDGNVTSATDSTNGIWTYTYDQFNRLVGSTQNTSPQTYVYDRYGNRLQEGASTYIFDNNNRISGSGVAYDALGHVTNDGFHSYMYDAEGRLMKVDGSASLTYKYDAQGRRIESPTYDSLYDLNGNAVALFTLSGVWSYGEIYAGGRHLATYSAGTTNFLHTDWLGTRRVATSVTGSTSDTCAGLVFGDGSTCTGTDPNFNHFTDYVHDSESNLEHTLFRQYSGTQGRFMTPDPYLGSIDTANPQSLNRYAYVLNRPLNFIDPFGLDCMINGQVDGSVGNSNDCAARDGTWDTSLGGQANWTFVQCPSCDPIDFPGLPSAGDRGSFIGPSSSGGSGTRLAPSKTGCAAKSLGSFALHGGIDALGAIPGEGAVAGVVQTAVGGAEALSAIQFGSGLATTAAGLGDTSALGVAGTSLGTAGIAIGIASKYGNLFKGAAETIPILGQVVAGASVVLDGYNAVQDYRACVAGH
jgi:RHS repeat-associated protein